MTYEDMKDGYPIQSTISQQELCEHLDEDDFFDRWPSPVLVEAENGQRVVLISWAQYQDFLRSRELAKMKAERDYDPRTQWELRITMDEELKDKLELVCAKEYMTVAGALEAFLRWTVKHPEDTKKWIEACREEGIVDECAANPEISIEWIPPESQR